jgi:uncharacterized RDD family membrane protein YckC
VNVSSNGDAVGRFVREVERWTPGPEKRQREVLSELEAHLRDAELAGELADVMADFGTPRDAARSLVEGRGRAPAPHWRRALGWLIDVASLVAIGALGLPLARLAGGTSDRVFVEIEHVVFLPKLGCAPGPCSTAGDFVFLSLVVAAAFWYAVVMTLLEWRYGRTLGKAVMRTRVISEDGTATTLTQAVIRRLPFFFLGPLQVIDWFFALFDSHRQRAFDRIARTLVVADSDSGRNGHD